MSSLGFIVEEDNRSKKGDGKKKKKAKIIRLQINIEKKIN
jgi:hypothetical protein